MENNIKCKIKTSVVECECGNNILIEDSEFEFDENKRRIKKIECEYCGAEFIAVRTFS